MSSFASASVSFSWNGFPSPQGNSESLSDGVFDDLGDLSDFDLDLAAEIDEFTDCFLQPLKTTSSCDTTKVNDKRLVVKSLLTKAASDMINDKTFSLFNFPEIKEENVLLPVTSSTLAVTTSSPPPLPTKLALNIPSIQPMTTSVEHSHFARPLPGITDQFIISEIPSATRPVVKRKRAHVDEECPTDGVLFKVLVDDCSLGVPSLFRVKNEDELLIFKSNRAEAKRKLDRKKRLAKQKKFMGHYPERKMVASARKRVGGRFVKENKAVFRPVH